MYKSAVSAYQAVDKNTISGRETEARVLTEAALKLVRVQEKWNTEERDQLLDEALRYNQRLWSLFQSELLQEDNPLPKKLRVDILRLSLFIDKRIFEVMAYPSPEKLKIIIKINQNLAAGLRDSAGSGF
ncbi:MAG: flagellar biosynthesis regulator FlaF [Desulfobacterales bacterium]